MTTTVRVTNPPGNNKDVWIQMCSGERATSAPTIVWPGNSHEFYIYGDLNATIKEIELKVGISA